MQPRSAVEELRWRKFPVLDDGFVTLVDVMGDDQSIVQAARVSFGAGTKTPSDDRTLIRFLMRHRHSTPFEMAEIKLLVRVPMDCWRQWIRHRTASVNEYSTRYSEAIDSAQKTLSDGWRVQSTANKQGSAGNLAEWPDGVHPDSVLSLYYLPENTTPGQYLCHRESDFQAQARRLYEERLAFGVAREQARKDLPLSTYTEAYWKCDLRNVFGFLELRMDSHAQQEIRAYADVIGRQIVAPLFPLAWEAFEDYVLGAVTLSATERRVVGLLVDGKKFSEACPLVGLENKREIAECREKLADLGMIGL